MHIKKYLLILVILAVMVLAVTFYFWESFLYVHYLGGYDAYGLPVQLTHPGFSFFFYSWPLWGFPVLVILLTGILLYLHRLVQDHEKIKNMQAENKKIKAKLETAELTHQTTTNDAYETLQDKYDELQREYQRSLDFIEKMLEQTASGK